MNCGGVVRRTSRRDCKLPTSGLTGIPVRSSGAVGDANRSRIEETGVRLQAAARSLRAPVTASCLSLCEAARQAALARLRDKVIPRDTVVKLHSHLSAGRASSGEPVRVSELPTARVRLRGCVVSSSSFGAARQQTVRQIDCGTARPPPRPPARLRVRMRDCPSLQDYCGERGKRGQNVASRTT